MLNLDLTRTHESLYDVIMEKGIVRKVCPLCGGRIVVRELCQYGRSRMLLKKGERAGKLSKVEKKEDFGTMEITLALCKKCNEEWSSDEFEFEIDDDGNFIDYKHADIV